MLSTEYEEKLQIFISSLFDNVNIFGYDHSFIDKMDETDCV